MKLLAALMAGSLALVLVALYLGDSSGSSIPTTDVSPTSVPAVRPKQEAIEFATENLESTFGDNHVEVTAEHMMAREASEIIRDMGIGGFGGLGVIADDEPICPSVGSDQEIFGCGLGLVYESAPGYLVLITGVPLSEADQPTAVEPFIQAYWVGDASALIGLNPAYPSATAVPSGSLLVQRTDWALKSAPIGNTLSITVAVGGGCDEFDRIATSEDENTVTVHAYIRETLPPTPPRYYACTSEMNLKDVTVQLDAPLGGRTLLGCNGYHTALLEPAESPVNCRRVGGY